MSDVLSNYLVHVVGGDSSYSGLAARIGPVTMDYDEADILIFTGGADVSPSLYGEQALARTACNPERDREEVSLYERLSHRKDKKRAYLGICRGGQLLNVLNGGTLWQHVHDHGRDHHVVDITTGKVYKCSSTHHQMFRVPLATHAIPYKVLGVACNSEGKVFENTEKFFDSKAYDRLDHDRRDIEAMYYPNSNSLCFQPHPEYWGYPQCAELFLHYVQTHVLPNLKKD